MALPLTSAAFQGARHVRHRPSPAACPKPAWLAETNGKALAEAGWPTGDALAQAKLDATLLWIKAQEDAGLRRHRRRRARAASTSCTASWSRWRASTSNTRSRWASASRPLQGHGAAGGGNAGAQGPGACCARRASCARTTKPPGEVHAARAHDHRRHRGRPLLRRPGEDGLRLRGTAEPGSTGAGGRRAWTSSSSTNPPSTSTWTTPPPGACRRWSARPQGLTLQDRRAHLLTATASRPTWTGRSRWATELAPVRGRCSPALAEEPHRPGQPGVHPQPRAARPDGAAEAGKDVMVGVIDVRQRRRWKQPRRSGRHHRPRAAVRAEGAPAPVHQLRPGADAARGGRSQAGRALAQGAALARERFK